MPGQYDDEGQWGAPEDRSWGAWDGGWAGAGATQFPPPDIYVPGNYRAPGADPADGGFGQSDTPPSGWYGQSGWHSGRRPKYEEAGGRLEAAPGGSYAPWGPASPWGGFPDVPGTAQPARRSHRRLWVALAVLAILLLAGGVLGVFGIQYFGHVGTAGRFCKSLRAQTYSGVYTLLSKQAQSAISEDDFVNDGVTLDRAEGSVLDCTPSGGGGSLNPAFWETAIAVTISLHRANIGALAGVAHLTNEDGLWKIDALDTSLWSVSLGAVQTTNTYCAALQSQAYNAAYAALGAKQTAGIKAADYTQQGQWRDQVDGPVGTCQIMSVGTANTATSASFQVSITRHRLGEKQDTISLDVESGAWKISAIGPLLQGTDLGGLVVMNRFCDDLSHGRYADAYGLFSAGAIGGSSEGYVAAQLSGQFTGLKWASCTFDASTYKVSGSSASLSVDINFEQLSTGHTYLLSVTFRLARFGHAWKLNAAQVQSS